VKHLEEDNSKELISLLLEHYKERVEIK